MLDPVRQHEFIPDWFSKPANSLLGLMKRREVPVEAVAGAIDGGIETLRGLIRGTLAIDDALARSLSVTVGGLAEFLAEASGELRPCSRSRPALGA